MSEPKPDYTITADTDMGATCPACGIAITIGNAGGYRTYCEGCADNAAQLTQAQTAVTNMLKECGLSQVIISADGKHNRYSKRGSNVYHTFGTLAELYADKRPRPQCRQAGLLEVTE